ncbi:hypothetical protein [Alcanivorax sp. DP30]|uniref:hypothetical protein n=1 Tax=Alcanivorax sp. DP30 TaxID=2606217 RepID=UPI00136AABCB|nr:hypothetical protein [Alcanivorax sp. DP30]MZR63824.1 hypothetical protein [Alcanivorax sp. DP30]
MSEVNSGGPAFPVPNDANVNDQEGMTLRDYFAAKAMQGAIANPHSPAPDWERVAEHAYAMADAMLAARDTDTTER